MQVVSEHRGSHPALTGGMRNLLKENYAKPALKGLLVLLIWLLHRTGWFQPDPASQ